MISFGCVYVCVFVRMIWVMFCQMKRIQNDSVTEFLCQLNIKWNIV